MEIRVLLLVDDDFARLKYLDALAAYGVRVFVSTSFFDLSEEIRSQTYHGLLLDVPTKMKALKENKAEVYRLTALFPVAHLQIDRLSGAIRCFFIGRQPGRTLDDFITSGCRTADPQKIIIYAKREIHLPVLLFRHLQSKRPERAITRDISVGGCFIISTRRWPKKGEIFLGFPGFADTAPIRGQIRTVVRWGAGYEIPGIGVNFESLSVSQVSELAGLCGPAGF